MNKEQIMAYMKQNKTLLAGVAGAAAVLVSFGAYALLPERSADAAQADSSRYEASESNSAAAPPPRMMENGTPFSFADLVERVSPAVVSVTAEATQRVAAGPDIPDEMRGFLFPFGGRPQMQPQVRKAQSAGSGFIIDKTGLIVTNNHVVDGATSIKVKLRDGRTYDAKLVGTDQATDVALLRVKPEKPLPTVEFGNDRALRVGDWVMAVGNPFGLANTVTAGIVSSIGRDLGSSDAPYTDFIQIDAPINPGNSGGPTFDLRGQVIGMNRMIYSPTGGSVGIGFAIPASTIKDVVAALETHGRVARGWLGVQIQSVTPDIAASLGIKEPKGALVANIVPDGPAAHSGIRQGDVILSINGKEVNDMHDVTRRVASLPAGKSASFAILRDGQRKTISVTIAAKKDTQVSSNAPGEGGTPTSTVTGNAVGLGLMSLTPEMRRAYNLDENIQGVLVTKVNPDSDAAEKGLQPGDVVVSVSTKAVHTPQDVEKGVAAAHSAGRKSVLLFVLTEGVSRFVAVALDKS